LKEPDAAFVDYDSLSADLDFLSTGTGIHGISDMPGHLIRRLHQAAVALFSETTADYSITPVQYATMAAAARFPSIDQRSLADLVAFDASTIGDVIRRLEGRGLLKRTPGVIDRRVKHVELTEDGHALLDEIDPLILQVQQALLAPLSSGEAAILMFLLRKLAALSNLRSPVPLRDPS
jgi:DNA-binding MarR family transcriptional regulator